MSSVTHQEITEKFEHFKSRINSLLATKGPIRELIPQQREALSLRAGLQANYRVMARGRPSPVKIHFELSVGVGSGRVYLSERIPRPEEGSCDKEWNLGTKEVYAIFHSEYEREHTFVSDFVYFTVEAGRDLTLHLECCFGRGIALSWQDICSCRVQEACRGP